MGKLKLLMIKADGCLRPFGDPAWEQFDKIKSAGRLVVSIHQARNPDHLNKFWALASRVANFDDSFMDADDAVRWVKRQIPGMHRRYRERDGAVVIELESIAIESMDQIRFNDFYDLALAIWAKRIGCDPETLRPEAA